MKKWVWKPMGLSVLNPLHSHHCVLTHLDFQQVSALLTRLSQHVAGKGHGVPEAKFILRAGILSVTGCMREYKTSTSSHLENPSFFTREGPCTIWLIHTWWLHLLPPMSLTGYTPASSCPLNMPKLSSTLRAFYLLCPPPGKLSPQLLTWLDSSHSAISA